jgi:hypothetical protein
MATSESTPIVSEQKTVNESHSNNPLASTVPTRLTECKCCCQNIPDLHTLLTTDDHSTEGKVSDTKQTVIFIHECPHVKYIPYIKSVKFVCIKNCDQQIKFSQLYVGKKLDSLQLINCPNLEMVSLKCSMIWLSNVKQKCIDTINRSETEYLNCENIIKQTL